MSDARSDVLSWDETFMSIADVLSKRSKDPSTQVGACVVSADRRILSGGYNGATKGFSDDDFPWGKTDGNPLLTKYPFVVHAERNAILNFRGSLREFEGATVYVTHFPCHECAKDIAQSGISEVVFRNDHNTSGLGDASLIIFKHARISVRQLSGISL